MRSLRRRRFLGTLAVPLGLVASSRQTFAVATDPQPAPADAIAVVERFLLSWSTRDMKEVLSHLTDDCECRLTQFAPVVHGHLAIAEQIAIYVERPQSIVTDIFDTHAAGPLVTSHYRDRYRYEHGELAWEGVGTFFVRDGKIREMRTYTVRVGSHVLS